MELESVPELVDPVLIAAFEGWNDAGEAATGALEHLEQVWGATPITSIDPDDYYDFQVNRPMVSVEDDDERTITWPTSRFSWARVPGARRDVVLLRGIEPNMRWRAFTAEILALASELGVETVVTLGALLADAPHTRPIPVTGTVTDSGVARQLDLEVSRYEGPTGIVGVLQDAAARIWMPSISLWAAV